VLTEGKIRKPAKAKMADEVKPTKKSNGPQKAKTVADEKPKSVRKRAAKKTEE